MGMAQSFDDEMKTSISLEWECGQLVQLQNAFQHALCLSDHVCSEHDANFDTKTLFNGSSKSRMNLWPPFCKKKRTGNPFVDKIFALNCRGSSFLFGLHAINGTFPAK